jgi:hypothetical protein
VKKTAKNSFICGENFGRTHFVEEGHYFGKEEQTFAGGLLSWGSPHIFIVEPIGTKSYPIGLTEVGPHYK